MYFCIVEIMFIRGILYILRSCLNIMDLLDVIL